jgi:ankyrin repeat protein
MFSHQPHPSQSVKAGGLRPLFTGLISILATPLIIFVVPTIWIFLANQTELSGNLGVTAYPLLGGALCLLAGVCLYLFKTVPLLNLALRYYHFLGASFFVFFALKEGRLPSADASWAFLVVLVLPAIGAWRFRRRLSLDRLTEIMAVFSAFLLLGNGAYFAMHLKSDPKTNSIATSEERRFPPSDLPNIYHIVLDGFQTDMFEATLTDEVRRLLAGFTYYPENIAVYGLTAMSMASVFSGRSYHYGEDQEAFIENAFNSKDSLIAWFKREGYLTVARTHPGYNNLPLDQFDRADAHAIRADASMRSYIRKVFASLWGFKILPLEIARKVLPDHSIEQLRSGSFLPNTSPIISYGGFMTFLRDEETLPSGGRYTYVHLIIPHFPFVLKEDCSYNGDYEITGPLEQSLCATSLIVRLIERLKGLGRFDDSIILIHGDHGQEFLIKEGQLKKVVGGFFSENYSFARSRALLLFKPAGVSTKEKLAVSHAKTTLLDIAPTLVETLGLEASGGMEGHSLLSTPFPERKMRYYYSFNKPSDESELTDEILRYRVQENGSLKLEDMIPVRLRSKPMAALLEEIYAKARTERISPLQMAIFQGQNAVAEFLITHGADLKAGDERGWMALTWAGYLARHKIAELLIAHGADVNGRDQNGRTPLHWIAYAGHTTVAELLIDRGADVNARDESGWTPIYGATYGGHKTLAHLLINHGAQVNVQDKDGVTPLHWAVERGDEAMVTLLLVNNAELKSIDREGKTPLRLAAEKGNAAVLQAIKENGGKE